MSIETKSSEFPRELVVLVHGSVTGGQETWHEQRSLSQEYAVVIPDRKGYGAGAPEAPDDPKADAATIGALLGQGAHLVGYSMGGLVAMLAAAGRPEAVKSLVLVEPAAFDLVRGRADVEGLHRRLRAVACE